VSVKTYILKKAH